MKKFIYFTFLSGILFTACHKNLLDQPHTTEVPATAFWKTEDDATVAVIGAYATARDVFDRDYLFDGLGDQVRVRGAASVVAGTPYHTGNNYGTSDYGQRWDNYYKGLYGLVNRANYVIANVEKMLPAFSSAASKANLERILGEAKLLRGMGYFRLISMWGDVPYFTNVMETLGAADTLVRMPIAMIKDSILSDFNYAVEKLPNTVSDYPRVAKPAALAFRGKLHLFWGSWHKYGWPELEGFTPSASEAQAAFTAASADFKAVCNNFGLTLYMNGAPGGTNALGAADNLPSYYHLFTPKANGNPETIMAFTHGGGVGTAYGESLMRDFGTRSTEGSQLWVHPRLPLVDRYQLVADGDYAPKLIASSASNAPTLANAARNPQSYAGRDYRLKATVVWDYEFMMTMNGLITTGYAPWIYLSYAVPVTINGVAYTTIRADSRNTNSGIIFRKFVRDGAGLGREEGDMAWPVLRLADVYLMYAEAANEVSNGAESSDRTEAIMYVNKVRARGNLPALAPSKTSGYQNLFNAIEQERIVELVAEGQRSFDMRRWRKMIEVWGAPNTNGITFTDTWNGEQQILFRNTDILQYQRNYIFKIPQSEIDRNPKITQNIPWR